MRVGYIRVSTKEQNTARQDTIMEDMKVERIYTDRVSGKSADRPELRKMMDFVREGDTVTVESISRFARNTKDLLELVSALEGKKVEFISQKESIDTSTPSGKFMLTVFGAIAELERAYILDRQAEGIAIAKAERRMTGRPACKSWFCLYRLSYSKNSKYSNIFVKLAFVANVANVMLPYYPKSTILYSSLQVDGGIERWQNKRREKHLSRRKRKKRKLLGEIEYTTSYKTESEKKIERLERQADNYAKRYNSLAEKTGDPPII